jgi:CubicO group peptidase (beta-lactamase class C family)
MRSPAHSALPALLALALGAGSAHAQLAPWCGPPAAARTVGVPSPALVARVDSVVQPLMAGARVPGLAVAVAVDGVVRWERAYGYADLEQCVPVTRFTMFRLASVSKPVTAIAALQLAEQRKLDLDAPIQRLVPEFPETPTPITVRQLLAHTSGIRHYRGDEAMSTRQYASLASALAIFAGDSLVHPPGTAYAYSTYGYTLLGLAVERAAGQPFLEQLRTRVLEPAGVSRCATMRSRPSCRAGRGATRATRVARSATRRSSTRATRCRGAAWWPPSATWRGSAPRSPPGASSCRHLPPDVGSRAHG